MAGHIDQIDAPGAIDGRRVKAIYLSDLHLDGSAQREHRVYAWLRATIDAHPELQTIVLAGDIVEGYFRRYDVAARCMVRLVAHLLTWSYAQVIYVPGNHDDLIGEQFVDSGGQFLVAKGGRLELPEDVHVLHGHQWARGIAAATYRTLDKLDWKGGRWVGRLEQRIAGRIKHDDTEDFRRGARDYIDRTGAQVLIHGHTHSPHFERHAGAVIIDLGSWVSRTTPPTYAARLDCGKHILSWVA